ncbi:hypothetical protein MOO46_03855 [Apilactobacillus apisilvae]|uniref:Uncharacterized protein n=1 Tax=Apilactobacillus apisilvae TaxID=2923364 RepID=A0ABY4PFG5_9LACO|nr:hypothetical protein [Apilactobacillus apisilvae]UQS84398.1 hypothetical protein MOO46_03855 [Apilactobacillus apisilvae]
MYEGYNFIDSVRGKINKCYYNNHKNDKYDYLLFLLKRKDVYESKLTAIVRIIGIKYFNKFEEPLSKELLLILKKGCPLYTKIEIQKVLSAGTKHTAILLISELGKIGNNQYLKVPMKTSKKSTYPIARDICARILQKMDIIAVSEIYINIQQNNMNNSQKSESLDVLEYCIFHNSLLGTLNLLKVIVNETKSENILCKWKAIRALSAFKNNDFVISYLEYLYTKEESEGIINEIKRSIRFVKIK